MIIDAYYPEDVYGHRNGSILGGAYALTTEPAGLIEVSLM